MSGALPAGCDSLAEQYAFTCNKGECESGLALRIEPTGYKCDFKQKVRSLSKEEIRILIASAELKQPHGSYSMEQWKSPQLVLESPNVEFLSETSAKWQPIVVRSELSWWGAEILFFAFFLVHCFGPYLKFRSVPAFISDSFAALAMQSVFIFIQLRTSLTEDRMAMSWRIYLGSMALLVAVSALIEIILLRRHHRKAIPAKTD